MHFTGIEVWFYHIQVGTELTSIRGGSSIPVSAVSNSYNENNPLLRDMIGRSRRPKRQAEKWSQLARWNTGRALLRMGRVESSPLRRSGLSWMDRNIRQLFVPAQQWTISDSGRPKARTGLWAFTRYRTVRCPGQYGIAEHKTLGSWEAIHRYNLKQPA